MMERIYFLEKGGVKNDGENIFFENSRIRHFFFSFNLNIGGAISVVI